MARISLLKKIKLYRAYRRVIIDEENALKQLGLKIDFVNRMYSVVNIPRNEIEQYELNTGDLDRLSTKYIKDRIVDIGKFLDSKGLQELYDLYDVKRVEKYSTLIVIGFKPFNTSKAARLIFYRIIPLLTILFAILAFKFL